MPSYLDFNSTKKLRDELLAKTLQKPNGPQTFNTSNYSIQNTRNIANRDLGDVTLNDDTSRATQLLSVDGSNRFGPENSEYEVLENTRILIDPAGNIGLYPYFPIADGILGRSLIGALNSGNYEFESTLAKFANYHLTESPDGPVQSRIRQNLKTATEGRARILDAVNGNLSSAINIIRGRERLIEKNYKITVAKTIPGKAIDFLQTVSGIEFPWSEIPGDYLTNPANPIVNRPVPKTELGKIFQDATGVLGSLLGIQRRPTQSRKPSDLMIEYLSDGQKDVLYDNLSFSTYAPNYTTRARSQNTSKLFNFVDSVATGINKVLGREAPEGKAYIGDDRGDDIKNVLEDFNQNKVLSPYYLSYKFDSKAAELFSNEKNISERGTIPGKLTWFSINSKNRLGANNTEYSSERGVFEDSLSTKHEFRDDSILGKTQQLLNSLPKNGGESRSHVANVIDQTSRVFREGTKLISRGSAIAYVDKATGVQDGTEYCRVWTKDRAYMNYTDTMKKTGTIRKIEDSVMSTPWNLNIAPMSNGNRSFVGSTNIDGIEGKAKKYMFSIENLAWKTSNKFGYTVNDLPICERGATGGRVMWFPPYDLKVNETNTANWDKNNFLGRPEPIYTYQNTERTGTISFKVVVDHPSILNLLIKEISDEEAENFLNSFFAGCYDVDFYTLVRKYITLDPSDLQLIMSYLEYYRKDSSGNFKREDTTTSLEFNNVAGEVIVKPGREEPIESPAADGRNTFGQVLADNIIYFPNDIPGPKTNIYVDAKSQSYDSVYNAYINDKENFKNQLASGLNTILTVDTKDNKADRVVIFGTEDPTSGGTISIQTLINDKKALIDTAFSQLQTNFGVISGATATLKSELEKKNVKQIKLTIESSTSFVADDSYNIKLSHRRSDSLIKYILKSISKDSNTIPEYKWDKTIEQLNTDTAQTNQTVTIDLKKLGYGEDIEGSMVVDFINKGEKATASGPETYDCTGKEIKNKTGLKKYAPITFYCRSASVVITYEQVNKTEPEKKTRFIPGETIVTPGKTDISEITTTKKRKPPLDVVKKLIMKALSECFYFKKLEETDPVVFGSLKEKLRYFHPAFHSMTPEGLNARLTFLHQCIRPGDTIPVKQLGTDINGTVVDARNTTFGPPPVCVLRIGDFYHSKIVITAMNITYENSTWDLNPEGIGVQPMVADVTLQVNFIGGQGIKEPVAKLQNALSSNFYANTEVYDYRADSTVDQDKLVKFNVDFLEKLTGGVETPKISEIPTEDKTKKDGTWIGSQNGTKMTYKEVIQSLFKSTNDYFTAFKNTYTKLTESYGKEFLPLFISQTYRTINQVDVQNTLSSTIQINLLGEYKQFVDFANLYGRVEKELLAKVSSSDHNVVLDLGFDSGTSKYDRSREIIDAYIKTTVTEFLNKIRDEKAAKELEQNRNKLVDLIDRVNFIVKTNGKDGRFDKKETTVATLANFDYTKFYTQYDEAINLIKDKHSIFTSELDNTINFNLPSFDDTAYKKILAFIIKDKVSIIKKLYDDSKDTKYFDQNAINRIEKRVEKFIKNNKSDSEIKKFKYKEAKLKKEIKPFDFSYTGTLSGQEIEILEKVHAIKGSAGATKLNFIKPSA